MDGRLSTFIELGVGFNPDLAARDNVLINGVMLGLSPAAARERFETVLEFSELHELRRPQAQELLVGHAGPARLLR